MAVRNSRINLTTLAVLVVFAWTTQAQLLLRKNDLSVKIGRSVYFLPEDFTFSPIKDTEKCRLEVVQNDPITQRAGRVEPQVFDCNFKRNSVKYIHSGFPLLSEDVVKLRAHKFTDLDTVTESFYLHVNIVNITYDVISRDHLQAVRVSEYYGISNPIDSSVIRLRYNTNSNVSCTVGFSKYKSQWPIAGQMVMGDKKRVVDAVKKDCREFLFMDLRYEHLKPPLPDVDYLPLTVSLYDPSLSDEVIVEQYFLPINIQGAFPNSLPRASFMSMYIMDVDQFVLSTIVPGVISAEDQETPVSDLIFNISKPLGQGEGYLVNLDDPTAPITSFLQDDLENHRIGFQPPNVSFAERKVYEVGFTVFDSHFAHSLPIMLHIAVRPSATQAPRVSLNKGLVLLEGQSRAITSQDLQIVDKDNIRNVRIFIKGGLKHGRLEVNGRATIYFTPADIHAGRVMYHHDDTDTVRDHIELRITDGRNTVRATFPVNIIPKDDSPPYLVSNLGLELNEGETAQISAQVLSAQDSDSLDDNIIFTIASPPKNGEVVQRIRPSDKGSLISQFGQRELLRGQVYYKHYGNEIFSDQFEFTVKDKQEPPNVSGKQLFRIHVNPVNDNPPQIVPEATRLMYVKETDVAYLSKSQLRYTDVETVDEDLLYTISSPPYFVYSSGREDAGQLIATHDLTMVMKDSNLPPVLAFKQSDINHMKIAYMPPMADIGPEPRLVRFVYTVQDGSGNKVLGQHFDIEVQPVNNQSPKFLTSKLLVEEGGVLSISTNQLSAMDYDTPLEDLVFGCNSVPRFGTLQKQGMTMKAGDTFAIKDLRKQAIRYLHDGSEVVLDSFVLNVSDGLHKVTKVITIDIVPVDDQAPQLYDNLHAHLIVSEGGEAVITKSILAARDEDTDDELLTFLVVKQPRHGILRLRGETVTKFTQQNVKDRAVKFVHTSGEIGPNTMYDSITFIVSDQVYPSPADLPVYDLNITITPVDDQRPVVLSGNPIFVNEGEKYRFTPEALGARDLDTPPFLLEFIITKQPQWGFVENTKPNPGSERSNAGVRVNSFKAQDVIDGTINYVQGNHIGAEPLYDSLELYATDGKLNSPLATVSITIVPQNDELPDVMLQDFILAEGGKMIIDQSMVDAIDLDLPKDPITFTISRPPQHGELMMIMHTENGKLNIPVEDFTIDELHSGMSLLYQHDNSETNHDRFSIKVSDGRHTVQKTCNITVTPINDEKPEVVKNTGLRIGYGESGFISSVVLQAEDKDNNDKHIYFIITKLPDRGQLQFRPDDEPPTKQSLWVDMEINQNFTQHHVDNNKVRYIHTGSMRNLESDHFTFVLSDGLNKRQTETFEVRITNSRKSPNIAVLNKGLRVEEGERKIITTANLSASDETTKAEEIVFAITKSPRLGQLEYINRPFISISSFTQLDLAAQLIVYHHLSKSDIVSDHFNFTVTNGFSESKDGIFSIRVNPHDKILPSLMINAALTVLQGSEEAVTPLHLKITDPDTPIQNLTFIIAKPPSYGHLYNRGVLITQSFTQYDIDRGYISYESYSSHSGLDHFLFMVTDGRHEGFLINETLQSQPVAFSIVVTPLQNDAPKLVVNKSPDTLEYLGRGRYGFILSNKNLRAEDSDTDPSQLMYILMERPKHGHLENVVSKRFVRRRFTQRDLDEVALWYVVEDNDGATNDSFAFRVEDIRGNLLDRKKFVLKWSRVEFARTDFVVCENMGSLSLTLTRTGSLEESAFVGIRVRDLSAKAGEDFTSSSARQVQFSPGVSTATWSLTFKEDHLEENNERLKLMLDQPVNTIIGERERARIQIIDADPQSGECPQYIGMISKNQPIDIGPLDFPLSAGSRKTVLSAHHQLAGPLPLSPRHDTLLSGVIKGAQQDESPDNREEQEPPPKPERKKKRKNKKKKNKKRRRKLKTKSRRDKKPNAVSSVTKSPIKPVPVIKPNPVPPRAPKSHLIQAPQKCDGSTKGLLHFDLENQQMFKCDGRMWNAWRPQQSQDDEQPSSHNCQPGWSEFDGRCYLYVNDKVSWNDAEQVCRVSHQADLVSVLSESHHKWLSALAGRNAFWIGLNDKRMTNKWEYLNGDPIAYTSWKNGTPRVAPRKKHKKNCVMVNRRKKWKNKKCDGPRAKILCEKQATTTTSHSNPSKGFFFGF